MVEVVLMGEELGVGASGWKIELRIRKGILDVRG